MPDLFRHKVYPSVIIEEPTNPEDVSWRVGDSWGHNTNDEEGFKSASCTLGGDRAYLRQWFEDNLGGHWKMEDIAGNEVWSGMIWSMRLVDEGWEQTRSLDDFANRIRVVYQSDVTGERLHMPSATTWYEADSYQKYGYRDLIQTIGEADSTRAGQLGQTYQYNKGYPGRSKNKTEAGGTTLSINLRGYMSTLGWRIYNETTLSGKANCDTVIGQIVTAVGQFIKATNLEVNAVQFPQYHNRDRYALTILRDIRTMGDGSYNPWLIGVFEDRTLIYKSISRTGYDLLWHEALPAPTRLDGSIKEPWLIRPGEIIRAPWLVPGHQLETYHQLDPTAVQVKEASFTAPYTVSLTGTHDERLDILLNRIQNTKW